MRSIVITGPAHPYRGGIASFNERLATEFVNQGWKVEIVTFTLQYPSFLFPGKNQYHDGKAPENFPISRKINAINPISWSTAARYINKLKPDYILTHLWHPYLAPSLGSVNRKVKATSIALIHNLYPHEKIFLDRTLSHRFVRDNDLFITLSEKIVNQLELLVAKEKITSSPHPIYDIYGDAVDRTKACQELGLNPNNNYLLFFGLVRAYKGLDILLEAFAKYKSKTNNTKLIIAGEFYEDENKYLEQIERLGLKEEIILHNYYILNEKVKHYFSAADLVAQTYRQITQSGILQIAIHFEKPVIATKVGAMTEMLEDNKHAYLTSIEPEEISKAINLFFQDPDKAKEFSTNMATLKKQYSWSSFYQAIEELIERQ